MLAKAINFIKIEIWRIKGEDLPKFKAYFLKTARFLILAVRGFLEDRCQLMASALTFYSLLSIVPVFALAFGIAKGFGLEKILEQELLERFAGQEEVVLRIISFSRNLLENTKGGIITGLGVILLFWTVLRVLTNIEKSFNEIWGMKEQKALRRKLGDYLSVAVICPIFIIISGSITMFINAKVTLLTNKIAVLHTFGPAIYFILRLLPYLIIWSVFSFIYIFIPNVKVRYTSGILAGIIAGTLFQLLQIGYINFQFFVTKYNAIYGSFAALPLFLIWLKLSWLILLFGAELSFAHQNVKLYEFEPDCLKLSLSFKKLLSLYLTQYVVKKFTSNQQPPNAEEISKELDIPMRLVRELLHELQTAGILSAVKVNDQEVGYQPAVDIDKISIGFVISSLENRGNNSLPITESDEIRKLREKLKEFWRISEISSANVLLKNI